MGTTSSVIGRLGRRTVLAVVGGVAVVAATVAIATAAVAGGGPDTPAPSGTSSSPSASSSPGKEGDGTQRGDDAWGRGGEGCCGENGPGWNAGDDGMEMGRRHMEDGMGMGDG
ncbi:hypothetical protein ABZ078_40520 [Streptomyces sp. NPDC006385]|uniref:hypothetical protein n=1 Tax=Streptomyces sp. NPDC006385 TaxID=3156761 RepID=UPI0033AE0D67